MTQECVDQNPISLSQNKSKVKESNQSVKSNLFELPAAPKSGFKEQLDSIFCPSAASIGQNNYTVFGLRWNHMSGEARRKILL